MSPPIVSQSTSESLGSLHQFLLLFYPWWDNFLLLYDLIHEVFCSIEKGRTGVVVAFDVLSFASWDILELTTCDGILNSLICQTRKTLKTGRHWSSTWCEPFLEFFPHLFSFLFGHLRVLRKGVLRCPVPSICQSLTSRGRFRLRSWLEADISLDSSRPTRDSETFVTVIEHAKCRVFQPLVPRPGLCSCMCSSSGTSRGLENHVSNGFCYDIESPQTGSSAIEKACWFSALNELLAIFSSSSLLRSSEKPASLMAF